MMQSYLDESLEQIVGVQTDKPFKRSMQPFGGIRMAKAACEAYGYELDKETEHIFTEYRKTHNQGVFDAYSKEMLACRKAGLLQVYQMLMAVVVLLEIIVVSHCTVLIS